MSDPSLELLSRGGTAALILALTFAVVHLWRRLNAAQDARVADLERVVRALADQNNKLDGLTRAIEEWTEEDR